MVAFLVVILLLGRTVFDVLIRFTSFLNTLHWPTGSDDFGNFGVSFRSF